jgi:hypothetical protein
MSEHCDTMPMIGAYRRALEHIVSARNKTWIFSICSHPDSEFFILCNEALIYVVSHPRQDEEVSKRDDRYDQSSKNKGDAAHYCI